MSTPVSKHGITIGFSIPPQEGWTVDVGFGAFTVVYDGSAAKLYAKGEHVIDLIPQQAEIIFRGLAANLHESLASEDQDRR